MATKRAAKPKPVPVTTVCDLCGIAWSLHGKEPTTDDCIRLLKIEVAKRPTWMTKTAEGFPKVVINKTITT